MERQLSGMNFGVYLFLVPLLHIVFCEDKVYTVLEEQRPNTFIGNIARDTNLQDAISSDNGLTYSILSTGSEFSKHFNITPDSGDLHTTDVLDREILCQFKSKCELPLEVAVRSSKDPFFRNIKIKINVEDLNDNAPLFPSQFMSLKISESSSIGYTVVFSGATDMDTGESNSLQEYEILPETLPFDVDFKKVLDGTSTVSLVLKEKLDRETVPFYVVNLVAKDGGNPQKSSMMTVNISVTDVNDNVPEFTHSTYNVTIKENTALNIVILTVSAHDKDSGQNGEVFYRLSQHQTQEIHRLFEMDKITGDIKIKKAVPSGHLTVIVEASDKGVSPKLSQASVEIEVLDTNNNSPTMTVNLLAPHISEQASVGSVVAHVAIADPDTGANGIVTCSLQSTDFKLQNLDVNEYKVVVSNQLDRELTETHTLTVFCQDAGSPKLNTSQSFEVKVDDENDNTPVFMQTVYTISIPENNAINDTIIQVGATDQDKDINSDITYKLSSNAWPWFSIHPNSPVIKAKKSFDRESTSLYNFRVFAVDGGNPQRTGTTTVIVKILDLNDERPEFTYPTYMFHVFENQAPGTLFGNLSAVDPDSGLGGDFSLSLSPPVMSNMLPFVILQNGSLLTSKILDAESLREYRFNIVATDKGVNPKQGFAQVTVIVLDENDNAPTFVFPNSEDHITAVYAPLNARKVVVRVQALDADSGVNSKLRYTMVDQNSSGIFEMDENTGEIYIAKNIGEEEIGFYEMWITVSDSGETPQTQSRNLQIVVKLKGDRNTGDSDQNIIIVISLVCATLIIAAMVLLALCYLRKRDRDRQLKNIYSQSAGNLGVQNPASQVDGQMNYTEQTEEEENTSRSSRIDSSVISGNLQMHGAKRKKVPPGSAPEKEIFKVEMSDKLEGTATADRAHQRLNQLMSFRLHQALQRLNTDGTPQQNKIMTADAKVRDWRDGQRQVDDFHSTSSGEITTGDSGHGSDEDSHVFSDKSLPSPHKIRLGVGAITHRHMNHSLALKKQGVPQGGSESATHGGQCFPHIVQNVPPLRPSHFQFASYNSDVGHYNSYSQNSPRSDTVDDGDDTTTSGSYSITLDDIKRDLPDFEFPQVRDVYV